MKLEEALDKLTPNAIYLWLWLQSKSNDDGRLEASYSDLAKMTDLTLQNVRTAVALLVTNKVANKEPNKDANKRNTLVVNKLNSTSVKMLTKSLTMLVTSEERKETPPSPTPPTTKEEESPPPKEKELSKESKEKKAPLKEWLDPELEEIWQTWLEYRQQLKKPYKTTISERMGYSKVIRQADGDKETFKSIIEKSIEKGWQGTFEPKGEGMATGVVLENAETNDYEEW